MVNARNRLIIDLEKEFYDKIEIVSLIYNTDVEIDKSDLNKISKFLSRTRKKNGLLILHGIGGCSNTGRALSIIFRRKFNKGFWTLVPRKTSSALLYTILLSSGVILSEDSIITPLDPYFYYKGRYLQAAIHLNDNDSQLCAKARKHWQDTADYCMKILHTHGSISVHPDRLNLNNLETIVRKLLNPKTHYSSLNYGDIKKMNFEYELCDKNDPFWQKVQQLVDLSLVDLSSRNLKFLIDTSSKSEEA